MTTPDIIVFVFKMGKTMADETHTYAVGAFSRYFLYYMWPNVLWISVRVLCCGIVLSRARFV